MGGRGSSSASSRSFTTGDKATDKMIAAALQKYKDETPSSKLTENIAKKTLEQTNNEPIMYVYDKAAIMVRSHEQNIRDVKNFDREVATREAAIERAEKQLAEIRSKTESKIVNKRGVMTVTRGDTYERLELAQQRRVGSLEQARKDYRSKKKMIDSFSDTFAEKIDALAKRGSRANNYKKNKK